MPRRTGNAQTGWRRRGSSWLLSYCLFHHPGSGSGVARVTAFDAGVTPGSSCSLRQAATFFAATSPPVVYIFTTVIHDYVSCDDLTRHEHDNLSLPLFLPFQPVSQSFLVAFYFHILVRRKAILGA